MSYTWPNHWVHSPDIIHSRGSQIHTKLAMFAKMINNKHSNKRDGLPIL